MRVICDMNEDQSILVLTNTDLDDIGVGVSVCLCGCVGGVRWSGGGGRWFVLWVGPDGQSVAAGWVPGPAGNLCSNQNYL